MQVMNARIGDKVTIAAERFKYKNKCESKSFSRNFISTGPAGPPATPMISNKLPMISNCHFITLQ